MGISRTCEWGLLLCGIWREARGDAGSTRRLLRYIAEALKISETQLQRLVFTMSGTVFVKRVFPHEDGASSAAIVIARELSIGVSSFSLDFPLSHYTPVPIAPHPTVLRSQSMSLSFYNNTLFHHKVHPCHSLPETPRYIILFLLSFSEQSSRNERQKRRRRVPRRLLPGHQTPRGALLR